MTPQTPTSKDAITIRTCLGELNFEKRSELYAAIGTLYQAVNQSNLEAAKAYFALGEMLIKSHEAMAEMGCRDTLKHLMADAGVHHRKGTRAIRWYKALKDSKTGAFSDSQYKDAKHEVVEAVNNGTQKARFDSAGDPTIKAVEVANGMRGSGDVIDPRVHSEKPFSPDDYVDPCPGKPSDMSAALAAMTDGRVDEDDDELDELDGLADTPPSRDLHFGGGAAGEQMTIDFDFRAEGREIHDRLDLAAQMLDDGELDPAIAAGIQNRVDDLDRYMRDSINTGAVA